MLIRVSCLLQQVLHSTDIISVQIELILKRICIGQLIHLRRSQFDDQSNMFDLALDPVADRCPVDCAGVLRAGVVVQADEEVFDRDGLVGQSLPEHFLEEGIIQPGRGIPLGYHFDCRRGRWNRLREP